MAAINMLILITLDSERNLEGFRPEEARAIALICGNKSLEMFKAIILKERSKKR